MQKTVATSLQVLTAYTRTPKPLPSPHTAPSLIYSSRTQKMASSSEASAVSEKAINRNPHPDFKATEASREDWNSASSWEYRKTKNPSWKLGDGANDNGASLSIPHVLIDPYEPGRPATSNYKLLISGIVPRPIGFLSTRSKDGSSTNLAPFSYTQVINHDPPLFIVGFAGGGVEKGKDSLRNLVETGECVINVISEHFVEAANATSINAPYGVSEWTLSGLTPAESAVVKPSRVKEAIFAVEGRLESVRDFESRGTPGKKTGTLAVIEGVRFWVREDAINEERSIIDPAVGFCWDERRTLEVC
jgi:flavin reductase (DIM6/NTAB) family NADH-FMN oxidoreductase RutF